MPDSPFGDHSDVELSAAKVKVAKLAAKGLQEMGPLKPTSDFGAYDTNGDGVITADDCPFEHGTTAAKMWWSNVQVPFIKASMNHPDAMHYMAKYGDKFQGFYNGKPLLRGISAQEVAGQGDYNFIVDRVMITQGLSKGAAQNVAGFIKSRLGR